MSNQLFDREKVSFNLVRLKKGGKTFEINVDADLAIAFREGKDIEIKDILKAEKIFSDAKKGLLASQHDMEDLLETSDALEAAEKIIKNGEIQLTQEYRQQLRENKKKKIIDIIHVNGVDPRTHSPHPLTRIENAFEEAKIRIDEFRKPEDQIQAILKDLRPVLPISFEIKEVMLRISSLHAPKCYSIVKSMGKITKEEWLNDGSWKVILEIPAGLEEELFDKLNKQTHGDIESETRSKE